MANHAQAEKRNRQRIKRQSHHRHFRTTMRTRVKRIRSALDLRDKQAAAAALTAAVPMIDRCAQKSVIPRRKASRLISRLSRAVNGL